MQAGCCADDVGDGVERTHLVEVHVLRRRAVHLGLGPGEPFEDVESPGPHWLGQRGVLEQVPYVAPGPHHVAAGDPHFDLRRGERAAGDSRAGQGDRLDTDRVDGRLHGLQRCAGVARVDDVGVAGIHRLLAVRAELDRADCLVVVAGMEGALPSVVGGLTGVPLVAVPTSVGYGSSFGGIAALLAMLNSCAPGVAVCNIDNGFGAGVFAARVARRASGARRESTGRTAEGTGA